MRQWNQWFRLLLYTYWNPFHYFISGAQLQSYRLFCERDGGGSSEDTGRWNEVCGLAISAGRVMGGGERSM
jgi:hypothetical protein